MDYTAVTEVTGNRVTREALSMLYTRYHTAAVFCEGKDVLEVACGSGQGLGYLAKRARRVVGGDYTENLIRGAQRHYRARIPLLLLDAHALPFQISSFDVIILYEAIYYLAQPEGFLEECRRVLRTKGSILICTVNKEWREFNPSPYSKHYLSCSELASLLKSHQFDVELFGAFPVSTGLVKDRIRSLLKRLAVTLHLMPKTMKGKEFLKQLFFGELLPLPPEVADGMAEAYPLVPIPGDTRNSLHKVVYAIAHMR